MRIEPAQPSSFFHLEIIFSIKNDNFPLDQKKVHTHVNDKSINFVFNSIAKTKQA